MLDHFKIIMKNHIDALNAGQFDFILYDRGAGGEFLSSLISEYSPNYNFKIPGDYMITGRFRTDIFFLANLFSGGIAGQINITEHTDGRLRAGTHIDLPLLMNINIAQDNRYLKEFRRNYIDYLKLDEHLSSGGRVLVRAQAIHPNYMNANNTRFILCDGIEEEQYRKKLCKAKLHCSDTEASAKLESIDKPYGNILMSRMFEEGYIENLYNITDKNFRNKLLRWKQHNKNLLDRTEFND